MVSSSPPEDARDFTHAPEVTDYEFDNLPLFQSPAEYEPLWTTPDGSVVRNTAGAFLPPTSVGYATTRGAADPSSMPRTATPSPVAVFRPTAFMPLQRVRLRSQGRARRPSCNQRTRGSRRSPSSSATSTSASRDGPSDPDLDEPPGQLKLAVDKPLRRLYSRAEIFAWIEASSAALDRGEPR